MTALLTLTTRAGIVDLVAVGRVLAGTLDGTTLTEAEQQYAAHALTKSGHGVSAVADTLHMNNGTARALLAKPYPHVVHPYDMPA